jgi:YggT family protein
MMMLYFMLDLINLILAVYIWTLLAYVISSWLINFNIINPYQPLIRWILGRLQDLHEPILTPIRHFLYRIIPNTGGLDLSPLVAFFGVQWFVAPALRRIINFVFG